MHRSETWRDFTCLPVFHHSDAASSQPTDIRVNRTALWTYCGPLLSLREADLPESYHKWQQTTIEGHLTPRLFSFLTFAHEIVESFGLSNYWLSIRATKSTTEFDVPQWHTDDDFFSSNSDSQSGTLRTQCKILTTLLGPGTLLIQDGAKARAIQRKIKHLHGGPGHDHSCSSFFRCTSCMLTTKIIQQKLNPALERLETTQAMAGQCVLIKTGEQYGTIHSTPPIPCDRVFVNIIPGTEHELRTLTAKYGMGYPRDWIMGGTNLTM
ncbi:hypothetical protein EJ08DRAFT_11967 [Tothia fuscella]|uniref:Uncharacterized protein n=1 Tax=Tothia fuscella TaxID=1048955 RepID=A0A9P4P5V3_9PEZI|nr:hypothetical protein EJ08DRAFT_11967 [Tothia fuscella]